MSTLAPPGLEGFFSKLMRGRIVDDDLQIVEISAVLSELMRTEEGERAVGVSGPAGYGCPLRIQWEFTNICNLGCAFCYNAPDRASGRGLPRDHVLALAETIAGMDVLEVVLTGGEIFADWEWLRAIGRRLTASGIGLHLITNGWSVEPEHLRELARWNVLSVQVSVDGADEAAHDALRGKAGSWRRAVRSLRLFAEAGFYTVAAAVLTTRNWRTVEDFIDFCLYLGVNRMLFGDLVLVGNGAACRDDLFLDPATYERCARQIWKRASAYCEQLDIMLARDMGFAIAHHLLHRPTTLVVRYDGSVIPHCLLPVVVGDLREESLDDVWQRNRGDNLDNDRLLAVLDALEVAITPELGLVRTCYGPGAAEVFL